MSQVTSQVSQTSVVPDLELSEAHNTHDPVADFETQFPVFNTHIDDTSDDSEPRAVPIFQQEHNIESSDSGDWYPFSTKAEFLIYVFMNSTTHPVVRFKNLHNYMFELPYR